MNFKPHDYQSYAIEYIENHPVSAVLLDMGLGKTVISLTAIADLLFDSFLAHRILVIAPLRVARDTWPAELKKWTHLNLSLIHISLNERVVERKFTVSPMYSCLSRISATVLAAHLCGTAGRCV